MGKLKSNEKNIKKSRKQIRKDGRKQKKVRKNEYYTNRNKPGRFVKKIIHDQPEKETKYGSDTKRNLISRKTMKEHSSVTQQFENIREVKIKKEKLLRAMKKTRKKQLVEANLEEDRNIKRLEKQLKLNKRKCKSIPKSFTSDGLDYLLEICDSNNLKSIMESEQNINEVNNDFQEDFALMTGQEMYHDHDNMLIDDMVSDSEETNRKSFDNTNNQKCKSPNSQNNKSQFNNTSDETDEDDISENDSYSDFSDQEDDDIEKVNIDDIASGDDNLYRNSGEDVSMTENVDTWEDIYGRLRDKDGNIITSKATYVPPAVRAKLEANLGDDKKRQEKIKRLQRQLKGLLNRLAESNMLSISNQIEELYMQNSRNDMNDTLTKLIMEALISNVTTPERLLLEHVLLIVILHSNIGTEVGAHFLQIVVKKFDELFNENIPSECKTLDNSVTLIAQLFNFKIFHSQLLYQILNRLSEEFTEKNVECILCVLRCVGFTMRKDDPMALKNLILDLQKKANDAADELKQNPRVRFMLDILLAIKNNNVNKIPNYDTTYSEHLKKVLKGFIRKGNYVTQLNINLNDLLKAEERGKWWVVGSAWTGKVGESPNTTVKEMCSSFSQKLLNLAKKQRMNTDTRKNLFCIIMSAEDYLDAFEKLLHMGLKKQEENDIVHVLLHCCLQEKQYNPYYSYLLQKFCEYDRKFQITIKYSIWDKVKSLTECSGAQISNLAKLLAHLFLEKGLPISVLKVVQFGDLDKTSLRFIRQILLKILLNENLEQTEEVFARISRSQKLKVFRDSLRLFVHHFLLNNVKEGSISQKDCEKLKERAKIVDKILTVTDKTRF